MASEYLSAMSQTSAISDSELFRELVNRKNLKHPTAAAFQVKNWLAAAAAIECPSLRDLRLLSSALRLGVSIQELRTRIDQHLLAPFTRRSGVRLLAAVANEQYLLLTRKLDRAARRLARNPEGSHIEVIGQNLVRSGTGQQMTGDDHVTQLIDTLPHWLHHLWQIPEDKTAPEPAEPWQTAMRAIMIGSVERGLRDLWHASLWEGYELVSTDEMEVIQPVDRSLAEKWLVWRLREESLLSWEAVIDAAAFKIASGRVAPVTPVNERTVTRVEQKPGQRRRFSVGRANGLSPVQRAHVSERDMLERIYTGIFLDENLPKFGALNLTCRELSGAWWVLSDLASLLVDEIGERRLYDRAGLALASCTVSLADLNLALAKALCIEEGRADLITKLFTSDPAKATELFGESLWHLPLLPARDGKVHIVLAPLFVGNPVRRIEYWLEMGGISDQGKVKGRGKPFEAHVRHVLADKTASNELLADFAILPHGLKRTGDSEEIDLLFRIGDIVVAGEVKCFTTPVEPNDRFNYLVALEGAAEQAARKRDWAEANRASVLAQLGVTDSNRANKARFLPLVVLNQGMGVGLEIDGVPFTDLHFLSLLLGTGHYQAETRFEPGQMAGAMVTMYRSQLELEARLRAILQNPPPLQRYDGMIQWHVEPFPTTGRKPLFIALPRLGGMPVTPGAMEAIADAVGPSIP